MYLLSTNSGTNSSSSQSLKKIKSAAYRKRSSMDANKLSKVFNHFYHSGGQNLFATSKKATYNELLEYIKEEMNSDLLTSRVLSRDLFAINDELTELFEHLTDVLNRRAYYNLYVKTGEPHVTHVCTRQYRANRASEESIMCPLLMVLEESNPSPPTRLQIDSGVQVLRVINRCGCDISTLWHFEHYRPYSQSPET